MKRNASFCCDDSRNIYENYYVKGQRGSGMPVFIGSRYQRGHGIGNILRSLLRHVVGFFTNNGRGAQFLRNNRDTMVSNLIKTGFEVADDVARGRKLKESLKKQVPRGIKRLLRTSIGKVVPERLQKNNSSAVVAVVVARVVVNRLTIYLGKKWLSYMQTVVSV